MEFLPGILKSDDHLIAVIERFAFIFHGGILKFLAVLVGAGQKENIFTENSMESGEHIGKNGRIRMTYMRFIVYIVDGGCYIKSIFHF
jgi:hypothetical protein